MMFFSAFVVFQATDSFPRGGDSGRIVLDGYMLLNQIDIQ